MSFNRFIWFMIILWKLKIPFQFVWCMPCVCHFICHDHMIKPPLVVHNSFSFKLIKIFEHVYIWCILIYLDFILTLLVWLHDHCDFKFGSKILSFNHSFALYCLRTPCHLIVFVRSMILCLEAILLRYVSHQDVE